MDSAPTKKRYIPPIRKSVDLDLQKFFAMSTGAANPYKTVFTAKFIVSGNKIEIAHHNKLCSKEWIHKSRPRPYVVQRQEPIERRADNIHRAKQKLHRLTNANLTRNSRFITLTIAENVTDRQKALQMFKKHVAKVEKAGLPYEYVATLETQERGAWHFHLLVFSFPYFKNETFQKLFWPHGFVKIKKLRDPTKGANYLAKYITKETVTDAYLRTYTCSQGLQQPKEIYDTRDQWTILMGLRGKHYCYTESKEYTSKFNKEYKTTYYELLPT